MNWIALIGVALFGGALFFGLKTGTMPMRGSAPFRDDEPVLFWSLGAFYALLLLVSLAAFVGLIK